MKPAFFNFIALTLLLALSGCYAGPGYVGSASSSYYGGYSGYGAPVGYYSRLNYYHSSIYPGDLNHRFYYPSGKKSWANPPVHHPRIRHKTAGNLSHNPPWVRRAPDPHKRPNPVFYPPGQRQHPATWYKERKRSPLPSERRTVRQRPVRTPHQSVTHPHQRAPLVRAEKDRAGQGHHPRSRSGNPSTPDRRRMVEDKSCRFRC